MRTERRLKREKIRRRAIEKTRSRKIGCYLHFHIYLNLYSIVQEENKCLANFRKEENKQQQYLLANNRGSKRKTATNRKFNENGKKVEKGKNQEKSNWKNQE